MSGSALSLVIVTIALEVLLFAILFAKGFGREWLQKRAPASLPGFAFALKAVVAALLCLGLLYKSHHVFELASGATRMPPLQASEIWFVLLVGGAVLLAGFLVYRSVAERRGWH